VDLGLHAARLALLISDFIGALPKPAFARSFGSEWAFQARSWLSMLIGQKSIFLNWLN
jgi:hypothetical protein